MPRLDLPFFNCPTTRELRAMWRRYPEGHEVRMLILEIVRAREQFKEAESLRQTVQSVWTEDTGGSHLVALHKLRLLLQDEVRRWDW
ncbi:MULTISPECIES: hypothetical protein [Burkholderia]|uniref:hypothetical protein n=1 Tax=Burkholderia TaxID=32008 RepID=UPI0011789261|nr:MULTISPECIES: hypothetical protein [Burkholderia]MBY4725198.1 hypothetical protein [Burkholderia contaminans]MCI3970788.1 hypothetical protein [Burkholderia sp. HI4860]